MLPCLVVVCAVLGSSLGERTESRTVRIDSGPVRGYKDPNEDIFVFYNIPYAKAPTGPDRFKAPLPTPAWSEPLEAVDKRIVCPQMEALLDSAHTKTMQEDCLIANVYLPATKKTNLPVIVYVHGGGFFMGFGDIITPKKMVASEEVIVVTFNYRLGAHGFLCLGTDDIPGNAGMKDQVALLRWVKRNIASFGGNPNDVTIAGYSSGSVSVDLLMLSKLTKGLFTKVIPESGANLSPFGVQIDPVQNAKDYGKILNFNDDDFQALEDFYKTASYEVLQSGLEQAYMFGTDVQFLMSPCVERKHQGEIFLEESPFNILNSGEFETVPMLYGFANMEGLLRISAFELWKEQMNENFADFLPADIQFKSDEERIEAANQVKSFYFKDKPIDEENILAFVDYISDTYFTCPTLRSINLQLKAGNKNIYLYEYSFIEDSTQFVPHTDVKGAEHCLQTVTVLDGIQLNVLDESEISEDFKEMKQIMRRLWTTFAKQGRPESSGVPAWPPVGEGMSPYMALKKNPQLGQSLLKERCTFWEEIYQDHYKSPIPPYIPPVTTSETNWASSLL